MEIIFIMVIGYISAAIIFELMKGLVNFLKPQNGGISTNKSIERMKNKP